MAIEKDAAAFAAWQQRMMLTDTVTARILGLSRTTVRAYREGKAEPPRSVAYACAALAYGLKPMW